MLSPLYLLAITLLNAFIFTIWVWNKEMQLLSLVCIETHQSDLKAQDTARAGALNLWVPESKTWWNTLWVLFDPALGFPLLGSQQQAPRLCHRPGSDMASGPVSSEVLQRPRLATLERLKNLKSKRMSTYNIHAKLLTSLSCASRTSAEHLFS